MVFLTFMYFSDSERVTISFLNYLMQNREGGVIGNTTLSVRHLHIISYHIIRNGAGGLTRDNFGKME